MKRPEIVNRIANVMHQQFPDVLLFLYGSEARGDARPDSDIDILVLLNKRSISLADRMELRSPLYEIELASGIQISPYFETVERWNSRNTEFTENVKKEGRLL